MTTTPAVLIDAKFAETALTEQYKSDKCTTAIDKFTATNRSVDIATLTVHLVPAGVAAADANAISKDIQPGDTWTFPALVGQNLKMNDTIWTECSIANAISIRASGRQFT